MTARATWGWLLRLRWPLGTGLAALAAVLTRNATPLDLSGFSRPGNELLAGQLGRVYATSWNQAGPLQLLGARLLLLGGVAGRPALVMMAVVDLGVILALRWVCHRYAVSRRRQLLLIAGTLVYLAPGGLWAGHPVEAGIPLLWLAGGSLAGRRWVLAGVALGLAALIAPWAILAAPGAFAARHRAVPTVLLAAAVAALGYLPFMATGHFAMFSFRWPVESSSLLHVLVPNLVEVPWGLRLVQGALAAGGCLLVARHGGADARWLAPLTAVLLRILLDPTPLPYYWVPIGVLILGALASGAVTTPGARRVGLIALAYLSYLALVGAPPILCGMGCAAALVLALGVRIGRPRLGQRGRRSEAGVNAVLRGADVR